jgi:hypothetical protein
MSSTAGIGGVSATLKNLLSDRVKWPPEFTAPVTPPPHVPVRVGVPPEDGDVDKDPLLNLFLYRVTENGFLKNQEIPGHSHPGNGYGHPPLSLNLHYLLTAYGALGDADVTAANPLDERIAHFLLGSAMQVFHDMPIIVRGATQSGGQQILHPSLRKEFEQIKLTLEPLTLEDVAKVWTALNRPYRLSAAYEVSVVQIESDAPPRYVRLVGELPTAGPRSRAVPSAGPRIDAVRGGELPGPYARIGDEIVVEGSNLAAEVTRAFLNNADATAGVITALDDEVILTVPDHPALQPGAVTVRIGHEIVFGDPPRRRPGPSSGVAVFVLVPSIEKMTKNLGASPRRIRLKGSRLIADNARCVALVGDRVIPRGDFLPNPVRTARDITVPLPDDLPDGKYAVRVRVNDAESLEAHELVIP